MIVGPTWLTGSVPVPNVTLHPGDNRDTLRRLIDQGVRVHSVVTDPPYGLTSVVKRFGTDKAAPAKFGKDGAFSRASAGFMNAKWDGTGIERDPEFWQLIHDILLPGGYALAFSSPRTGHWQACAMELAGFVMHPFLGWLYGSGFPKDHDVAMAIDKALGVQGSRGGAKPGFEGHYGKDNLRSLRESGTMSQENGFSRPWMDDPEKMKAYQSRYIPGSPEAQQWDGWSYGGQSLKPALEPIYVGQKPFSEKNGALSILKHGAGGVNIDGCRVGDEPMGRHPANLLHDGSDEVVGLFPANAGAAAPVKGSEPSSKTDNCYGEYAGRTCSDRTGDSGSAARFFNSFPLDADPIMYQSKATKADRAGSKHPTVKPIALMRWLCRLVTPPGGIVLDPFAGSGTTGQAALDEGFVSILMEAEEQFAEDIRRRFKLPAPIAAVNDDFDTLLGAAGDDFNLLLG